MYDFPATVSKSLLTVMGTLSDAHTPQGAGVPCHTAGNPARPLHRARVSSQLQFSPPLIICLAGSSC